MRAKEGTNSKDSREGGRLRKKERLEEGGARKGGGRWAGGVRAEGRYKKKTQNQGGWLERRDDLAKTS